METGRCVGYNVCIHILVHTYFPLPSFFLNEITESVTTLVSNFHVGGFAYRLYSIYKSMKRGNLAFQQLVNCHDNHDTEKLIKTI